MGLRRRTLQVAARIVEHRLNADHSDYQGGNCAAGVGRTLATSIVGGRLSPACWEN